MKQTFWQTYVLTFLWLGRIFGYVFAAVSLLIFATWLPDLVNSPDGMMIFGRVSVTALFVAVGLVVAYVNGKLIRRYHAHMRSRIGKGDGL